MTRLPALPDKRALIEQLRPHRSKWDADFRPQGFVPAGPGEESVWDYPRPPIIVPVEACLSVKHGAHLIAKTQRALAMKETAGAPAPYFPPDDVETQWLQPNGQISLCEWKGAAISYDLILPSGERIASAAWTYPDPLTDLGKGYEAAAGWFGFYPAKLACFSGEERVRPQPGGLYGGWVTDRIKGPIKGGPGTGHW